MSDWQRRHGKRRNRGIASEIYGELKKHFSVFYDDKSAVGRRYRRQDEIGTPFCITVDGQTVQDPVQNYGIRFGIVSDGV